MAYKWEIIKDFQGRSHAEGGIDITISGGRIELKRNNSTVKAANGLLIPFEPVDGGPKKVEQPAYSKEPSEAHRKVFEEVRQQYLTNLQKPEYRERLRKGMYGDTEPGDEMERQMRETVLDQQLKQRDKYARETPFTVNGMIDDRAFYNKKQGIVMDPIDYSKYPQKYWSDHRDQVSKYVHSFKQIDDDTAADVLRHEFAHALDQELDKEFRIKSDINSRERLNNGKPYFNDTGIPENYIIHLRDILSRKNDKGLLKKEKELLPYLQHDTEVSARINALRLDAEKQGYKYEDEFRVQDYFPETIDEMKKDMDKYHHLYDLKKTLKLTDDEINELAKLIASNNSQDNKGQA